MIKAASVHTFELERSEIAVKEMTDQLSGFPLLKNTAGILMCDHEFVRSGIAKRICQAFDFPIVGATSASQATHDAVGDMMLTLMVLTSDDIIFSAGKTGDLTEQIDERVSQAIGQTLADVKEPPGLVLVFLPLIQENAGDFYITALERSLGKTPIFGSAAVSDDAIAFAESATIFNGDASEAAMSFLLLSGNVTPRFFIATISQQSVLPYAGEITKAEGNLVQEINGVSVIEYFENIGLAQDGQLPVGVQFVPLLVDVKRAADYDGVPIVRAMVKINEDGNAICRGIMQEGSVFTIGACSREDVLRSAAETLKSLDALDDAQAVLCFSCIVRRMAMGLDVLTEAQTVRDAIPPHLPFAMGYAVGELCPTSVTEGRAANRFHNHSLIVCVL